MKKSEILKGLSVSTGVGIGKIHRIQTKKASEKLHIFTTVEEEKQRLSVAIDQFCYKTYHVFQKMRNLLGQEEALILGGQIFMARDLEFLDELDLKILEENTAEQAVEAVIDHYLSFFQDMEDKLMSQRSADLTDMRDSILQLLSGEVMELNLEQLRGVVLCLDDITPSMMACVSSENVVGILCQRGGITSHCAILARASGIPAIFGIPKLLERVRDDDAVIVDGLIGIALKNPNEITLDKYREKAFYLEKKRKELETYRKCSTKNARGEKLSLLANISDLAQLHTALDLGVDGVGLFRTEYLFMSRKTLPTEEEQFRSYCRLAKLMEGRTVNIRTLDIGGDKEAPCLPGEPEDNPFLGQRAIRYCLEHEDVFLTQIRAILRATGQYNNITITLPMITTLDEIKQAKALIASCCEDLRGEGYAVGEHIPVGIVVETPSAAMILDRLIEYVDYVSVGTNDLTQYIMAVDRGNVRLAEYYSPFQLGVLRLLKFIITTCNERHVPCTICGEAVCDPRMIPLLLAFGEVNYSVAPASILAIRKELSSWSREAASVLALGALELTSCDEIEEFLRDSLIDNEEKLLMGSTG